VIVGADDLHAGLAYVSKLSDRELAPANGADKLLFKLGRAALEKDRINQLY
jgi:hypothetical protein